MTKQEFLDKLESLLWDISLEDREDAILFYREYLEDAGQENEELALQGLGDVQQLAQQIRAACATAAASSSNPSSTSAQKEESPRWPAPSQYMNSRYSQSNLYPPKNKTAKSDSFASIVVIIILLLITAPVWLGILGGIFGIWLAFLLCIISGGICAVVGLFAIGFAGLSGLLLFGVGLIITGISLMIFSGINWVIWVIVRPFIKVGFRFCRNLFFPAKS